MPRRWWEGEMAVEIKPWRLDPLEYEECLEYVLRGETGRLIVPRTLPQTDRLISQLCFLKGSYLVTGYRGVGKTSFVNYALALAYKQLSSLKPPGVLVRVPLSLARKYETEKLLRRAIRQLYRAVIHTNIEWPGDDGPRHRSLYSLLPGDLQDELTIAYQKTSARVSEAATEALKTVIATATTDEFRVGGEVRGETTIRPDPLPAKLGATLSGGYKRSKTTSKEEETARKTVDTLEYLEYDDEIAEAELMRLIKHLTRRPITLHFQKPEPVPRKCPWFWRMWGKIRRRNYLQRMVEHQEVRNLHLVFVFDELDKVNGDDAEEMLKSLKGLLTSGDATFLFIGGWEFANRWLSRTSPEGDLLYSLFNDVIYVPLYTDEELDIFFREIVADPPQAHELVQLWEHIKLHCGRTPRELLRQLSRFVRWEQGKLVLNHQETSLFSHLFPHVHRVNSQIDDALPPEVRDALIRRTDQWLMFAEQQAAFTLDALKNTSTGSEETKETEFISGAGQQALNDHFGNFLDVMLEAGVFQAEEGPDERYRFNPNFSLGTWMRRTPSVTFPEELEPSATLLGPKEAETARTPTPPFEVPPRLANFVDREAELRAIRQALDTGASLVQILGMGGIGKTAVAVEIAHRMHERFPDGVLWVSLESGTTLENVLHHIALSYGQVLAEMETEALAAQVRSLLASKKALIVLDSAENLSEDELRQLLPGVPNCPVLITTRTRFTELERLGQTVSVGVLPDDDSLALLRRSAGYRRVSADKDLALQVCQLLGHHPLALEVAGRLAQIRNWDMQTLLNNLQTSMGDTPEMDTPIANVSRAFSASYDSLTDEQKGVLMASSIFEGDFVADGVAYLLGDQPPGTVEYLLDGLANRSLISRGRERTFRVHPLIRTYVRRVADKDALEKMRRRHARYMLRWVRKVKGEAR